MWTSGRPSRRSSGLARDTGRTDHVFTIISSLSGGTLERTYQAFRRTAHGKRLLRERPDLKAILSDRAALGALPEGCLGARVPALHG